MAKLTEKQNKIISGVINVVTILICMIVLLIVISAISSAKKDYNVFLGSIFLTVASDSMEPDINEGDIIRVKELDESDVVSLKEGDVITFWALINGERALNTHKINKIIHEDGYVYFETYGINNFDADGSRYLDPSYTRQDEVVGIYKAKMNAVGKAVLFLQSKTGFMVFALVPSILILIYCIVVVIMSFTSFYKEKYAFAKVQDIELTKKEMFEQAKQELLRELMQQNNMNLNNNNNIAQPSSDQLASGQQENTDNSLKDNTENVNNENTDE